jgi:hypothetical protein
MTTIQTVEQGAEIAADRPTPPLPVTPVRVWASMKMTLQLAPYENAEFNVGASVELQPQVAPSAALRLLSAMLTEALQNAFRTGVARNLQIGPTWVFDDLNVPLAALAATPQPDLYQPDPLFIVGLVKRLDKDPITGVRAATLTAHDGRVFQVAMTQKQLGDVADLLSLDILDLDSLMATPAAGGYSFDGLVQPIGLLCRARQSIAFDGRYAAQSFELAAE